MSNDLKRDYQYMGKNGERKAAAWLYRMGFSPTIEADYRSSFDISCNDMRLEVKTAIIRKVVRKYKDREYSYDCWKFNIHRHNKLNERGVRAYIFICMKSLRDRMPRFIIRKAPIGSKTFYLGKYKLKVSDHFDVAAILGLPKERM
jgi:hypothetical protein